MSYREGLVSIIVPVYNTDPFLMDRCIKSIKKQTYLNLEILIVNDGSSNLATINYLDKVKDERVSILTKDNEGVSSARNMGLKKANGKYVFFLDSDDYIADDLIEKLVVEIDSGNYVAVVSKMIRVVNSMQYALPYIPDGKMNLKKDFTKVMTNTINFTSQGILIRADIAKKNRFKQNLKFGEDFQYSLRVLSYGNFFYSNKSAYYYVQNAYSALHCINLENAERYLSDFYSIYSEINMNKDYNSGVISYMMCDKINLTLNRCCTLGVFDYKQYRSLAKNARKYLLSTKMPRMISSIHRNIFVFAYYRRLYFLNYCLMQIKNVLRKKRDVRA